jgi:hypothetical protein
MIVPSSERIVGPGSAVVVVGERAITTVDLSSLPSRQAAPTSIDAASTRAEALCVVRLRVRDTAIPRILVVRS